MRLQARLALLMVFLVLLPALPAAWMARELVTRSLNLGLSAEIDTALESGVRQARERYLRQRQMLADSLDAWIAHAAGGTETAEQVLRAATESTEPRLPGDRAVLRLPGGDLRILRAGRTDPADSAGVTFSAEPQPGSHPAGRAGAEPSGSRGERREPSGTTPGGPPGPSPEPPPDTVPHSLTVTRSLPDGSTLSVRQATSEAWRRDAQSIATALQTMRGLRSQRQELERGFWMPFLSLYAASVLVAVIVAWGLARRLLAPMHRLLTAMREVGAGNWSVRVPVSGRDEFSRLSEHFNDMIQRLDAQSRRLVDLETMAGWREMARALAHEVKNPLTPIQLTVEEMRERYRGEDREYAALLEECSRIVIQEVDSLRNVVARFREFSRPVEPRFAPVDLNALIADVGALQRDMHVEFDLAPDLGIVHADDDRLRQVLMNLARNAQTATAGREAPRLRLATRPAGESVVVVIEDNGPGIPEEERERVFEPYRSGSAGGLGLGLALVKGIILAHGGSIRVEEGGWGGARLHVELPRHPEVKHD